MKIKIAALQFNILTGKVEENLSTADKLLGKLKKSEVNFIVLPELWATGFAFDNLSQLTKQYTHKILDYLSIKAKALNSYIISGSLTSLRNNDLYNIAYLIDPKGKIVGQSAKIHLFSPTKEDKYFKPGKDIKVFKTKYGKVGIIICYDLRFPEQTRKLALQGAKIVFVPSQYPDPKQEHWTTLIKARALENQVFVVGVNRIGGKKLVHFGKTMVVGPDGEIIDQLGRKPGILMTNIDLNEITKQAKYIPVFASRRKDIY